MSSRERRLLDKDIEIRKLQGELKHYKTCFFSCVFEKDRTRKALDVAVDALGYYASENSWDETNRWMFVENGFEFAKDVLEQITALTKGDDNE